MSKEAVIKISAIIASSLGIGLRSVGNFSLSPIPNIIRPKKKKEWKAEIKRSETSNAPADKSTTTNGEVVTKLSKKEARRAEASIKPASPPTLYWRRKIPSMKG